MLCGSEYFIVNRRERRVCEPGAQAAIGFDRCFVGSHCEQDRHSDGTAPRFFDEANLMRHSEEGFEGFVAKIDDLRRILVRDQAIEQGHLAADVANGRRRGLFRQKVGEGFLAGIEIERRDSTTLLPMKISKQSCQQSLADAGAG